MDFNELPFSIILYLCAYLDVESLVALADVNREMRRLAGSYKSFWIPSVLQDGLVLPLPVRPLISFSPSELSVATRRALFRNRNLSKEAPELYSSIRITWPYARRKSSTENVLLGDDLSTLQAMDVLWIPSFHSNGEWYFTLSKDYVLRIIHLRSEELVLEEHLHRYVDDDISVSPAEYSFDCVDDVEVRLAVVTPYQTRDAPDNQTASFRSTLLTYRVTLDPQLVTASITSLAQTPLTVVPRHLDIVGDYAVLVEDQEPDEEDWPGSGPVHVVGWETGKSFKLPPDLLNSFAIAVFPDYFISLGVTATRNIVMQVTGFPHIRQQTDRGSQLIGHDEEGVSSFVLAGSVPIESESEDVSLLASDELALICHYYTGRTINSIRLWIRDDFYGESYSVFTIPVDFGKSPENWFMPLVPPTLQQDERLRYPMEHRRLSEKEGVTRALVPGTCGKRFFWWREKFQTINPEPDQPLRDGAGVEIQLYSSDADTLPPLALEIKKTGEETQPSGESSDEEAIDRRKYEQCTDYPEREMAFPFECDMLEAPWEDEEDSTTVYSIMTEEWSGTVLVTLACGDIIVLRYGHP